MNSDYDLEHAFDFPEWASRQSTQRPGIARIVGVNASPFPESIAHISTPNETPRSLSHTPSESRLTFLQEADWDPEKIYDDDEYPSCLRYSIEWKVTMNGKAISRDTEPEVLVAPGCFWRRILQARLEELLRTKFAANRAMRSDDTTVTVSVTQRSQRDLVKRFPQTKINWPIVEKKLHTWSRYFQDGKELHLKLSFNYVDMTSATGRFAKKHDKRGAVSATRLMLAQRDADVNAEEEASGQSANWQRVFAFFRCPGSCDRGPHCWIDSDGKKHYRLRAPHLRLLVEYVEENGMLESHDDMPTDIRQQLYSEERQRQDRKTKDSLPSSFSVPPINITNVLPGPSQSPLPTYGPEASRPGHAPSAARARELEIPGFRDDALREYTRWQQSRVRDPSQRAEYQKACDAALKVGFDLELIYEKQNCDFFVQAGVILGVAERFPRDIFTWNETQRSDST